MEYSQGVPSPRPPTTTSLAILGQLARRPWTAYELSRQTRRNFRFFWPRAESQLYAEMKALARDGLAAADRHKNGRRVTTTYSITPAGREALSEWLARPATPPTLEMEAALRVFLGPLGSLADLRQALGGLEGFLEEAYAVADTVGSEYVAGTSEFQDQVHVRALIFDLLTSYFAMLDDWRGRAEREVATWRGTRGTAPERAQAVERIRRILGSEVRPRATRLRGRTGRS